MFIYVWTWTSLQPDVSIVCLRIRASLTSVILQYSIVDKALSCTCFIFALPCLFIVDTGRVPSSCTFIRMRPGITFFRISIRYKVHWPEHSKCQITVYLQCHSDKADISPQKTINIFDIFEIQLQGPLVNSNHHFTYTLHSLKMFISQMICCAVGISLVSKPIPSCLSLIVASAKRMIN